MQRMRHPTSRTGWRTGEPRMQAAGACVRKLVMICYGVLKNRRPFDPAWSSRIIR